MLQSREKLPKLPPLALKSKSLPPSMMVRFHIHLPAVTAFYACARPRIKRRAARPISRLTASPFAKSPAAIKTLNNNKSRPYRAVKPAISGSEPAASTGGKYEARAFITLNYAGNLGWGLDWRGWSNGQRNLADCSLAFLLRFTGGDLMPTDFRTGTNSSGFCAALGTFLRFIGNTPPI